MLNADPVDDVFAVRWQAITTELFMGASDLPPKIASSVSF
jgi:hypothetical protein